jgi:hypothetical protein
MASFCGGLIQIMQMEYTIRLEQTDRILSTSVKLLTTEKQD